MPRKRILLLTTAIVLLACVMPSLVPTPAPLPSPTPTWTLLPLIAPDGTPAPKPEATESTVEEATSLPGDAATNAPTATENNVSIDPPPAEFACPGAPAIRLAVGMQARVTFTDGLPLRVRRDPVVEDDNVVAQIAEGTAIQITGGPTCADIPDTDDDFVFWQIRVEESGIVGWVAEGDSESYFIEPVP